MRKKYSIGFLILTILVVFLLILGYRISYHKMLSKQEEAQAQEDAPQKEEGFYIKAADGYVTVYLGDGKTVYEYTSILVSELPDAIQKELENGKKVDSLGQVYGFLENYSS